MHVPSKTGVKFSVLVHILYQYCRAGTSYGILTGLTRDQR